MTKHNNPIENEGGLPTIEPFRQKPLGDPPDERRLGITQLRPLPEVAADLGTFFETEHGGFLGNWLPSYLRRDLEKIGRN